MGKKKVRNPSASKKRNDISSQSRNSHPDMNQDIRSGNDFIRQTLDHKNYEVSLTKVDIVNIVKYQYKWNDINSDVIFKVIGPTARLKSYLIRHRDRLQKPDKKSLTFIMNLSKDDNHWVFLIIVYENSNFYGYYIDPLRNNKIPDGIRQDFRKSFQGIEPTAVRIEQQSHIYNCGILALQYARILNEGLLEMDWPAGLRIGLYHLWRYKPTDNDLRDIRINFAQKLRDPNFVNPNIPSQDTSRDSQLSLQTSGSVGTEKKPSSGDRNSEIQSFVPDAIHPMQESPEFIRFEFDENSVDINNELLIASGYGDFDNVKSLIDKKADVNCSDIHGNRPLHWAVKSGELKVVELLLDKVEEVHEFNNEHETPLDIAIKNNNQSIIDALVQKIIKDAEKIREDVSSKKPEPPESKSHEKLTPGEEAVEKTRKKILSCLKSLTILNKHQTNAGDQLTYDHAIILICFVEALSLQGSGRNSDVKAEMEKHFSLCYTNEDRERIRNVRDILLKSPGRKLGLENVRKLFKSDVKSFFMQLQQYLENVKMNLQMADIFVALMKAVTTKTAKTRNTTNTTKNLEIGSAAALQEKRRDKIESSMESFKNSIKNEDKDKNVVSREKYNIVWKCYNEVSNLGYLSNTEIKISIMDPLDCDKVISLVNICELKQYMELIKTNGSKCEVIRLDTLLTDNPRRKPSKVKKDIIDSFLRDEFRELIKTASKKEKITHEHLFNFLVNFYPAFTEAIDNKQCSDFKELRTLRNSLIHEFHEHGCMIYADYVSKLIHRLFRYCFAQDVHNELVLYGTKKGKRIDALHGNLKIKLDAFNKQLQHVVEAEHIIPEECATQNFEYKLSEKILPAKSDKGVEILVNRYLWFTILIDYQESAQQDSHAYNHLREYFIDPGFSMTREEPISRLSDFERRNLFDEFCSLDQVTKDKKFQDFKKQEFRKKIIIIDSNHFDQIYELYKESTNESCQARMFDQLNVESRKITKIMNTFKRLKVNYKLSNQRIIALYQRFLEDKNIYDLITDFDESTQRKINFPFAYLPKAKIVHIKLKNKIFSLRLVELIGNMLDTFFDGFNKYCMEFTVEGMFNDVIFLDYLVAKETQEQNIEELVEQYLKLTLLIDLEKDKIKENSSTAKLDGSARRRIFEEFFRLKILFRNKEKNEEYFEIEKQKLLDFLLHYRIKSIHFDRLYELCIEADCELENKVEVERIKGIIKSLRKEQRTYHLSGKDISCLWDKVVRKKGDVSVGQVKDIVGDKDDKTIEKIVEKLKMFYTNQHLNKNQVCIKLDTESSILSITKIVADMLEAFEGKYQFIHNERIRSMARGLKTVDYIAPYIVRLLKKVGNDELIERKDLEKLVAILITGEGCLYIEYVKELLYIKSGKLNLYEEVFNQIRDRALDVRILRPVFEIPQHFTEILDLLNRRIDDNYQDEKFRKTVKITEDALELCNDLIFEFVKENEHYEMIYNIVISVVHLFDKTIIKKKSLDKDYSIGVNDQLRRVGLLLRIVIFIEHGMIKTNTDRRFDSYYKYLVCLITSDTLDALPITDTKDQLLRLRVLAYRTLVLDFSGQYNDEYFATIDNLHREIVKYSLDKDFVGDTHIKEIYAATESREKYKTLLDDKVTGFSFDIVRISLHKVYRMMSLATRVADGDTLDIENVQNGLQILREVFSYSKKQSRLSLKQIDSGVVPSWRGRSTADMFSSFLIPLLGTMQGNRRSDAWKYQDRINLVKEIIERLAYILADSIWGIKYQIKISGDNYQAIQDDVFAVNMILKQIGLVYYSHLELLALKKNYSKKASQMRIKKEHRKRSK